MIGDKEQVELLDYLAHQYGYLFSMYVVSKINDFQRVFSRDLTGMKAHKCKED